MFWKGFMSGFRSFGQGIAALVNTTLLTAVYLTGVTFTALAARLVKKHFLATRIEKSRKSYWNDLNLKKKPLEEHYRQF